MGITRPTGEQLRFRSAATGDHILDTYMENSEKGSRTLPDLMDDLFDGSGVFRAANFEFRFDETTDKIQFRAGNFANSNAGWTDITTFFDITGAFNASTTYNNFDLITLTNKDVYIVHGLSSGTTFADEAAVIASANTDKLVDVSEARDWAKKTDGIVDSTDYSSKAWAIGGTGVTNGANKGAAKEWATKIGSTVDGSDYSAKHWATTGTVATVSSGIANINTVAAAIANVNTTATNISNVNTVAGISANVTTVAGISANVTTVATNNANITTVATNNSNINSLATNMADINTVADEIDNNKLQTVADNINAVVTAADDLNESTSEIEVVANNIANVNAVGGSIANVNTVAGIAANVTTVAGISANTTTVAGIAANVTTVAGIAADVTTAAANTTAFNNLYLGAQSSAPTQDPDGSALDVGDLYFDTTSNTMKVYASGGWTAAGSSVNGTSNRFSYTATAGQTVFAATYDAGYVDVYLNGVKQLVGTDVTATSGTSVVFASGTTVNDIVEIIAYGTFVLADHLTQTQSDARYVNVAGDTMTGSLSFGDSDKAIFGAGSDLQIYHDGSHSYISDQGTGNLRVLATNFNVKDATGTRDLFYAQDGGLTKIYYNGLDRIETTSTGVDITGTVTADGFQADSGNTNYNLLARNSSNVAAYIQNGGSGPVLEARSGSMSAGQGDLHLKVANNGDISFYEDTGTTAKFFWDASAERLGVGTSSPSRLAELYGTSNPALRLNNGTDVADIGIATSAGALLTGSTSGALVLARGGSNSINLGTNGQNRLTIDSSGNVGIGTSSIDVSTQAGGSGYRVLQIESADGGQLNFDHNDAGTGSTLGQINFQRAGEVLAEIEAVTSGATDSGHIGFRTQATGGALTERMRLDASGSLLVGKSSAGAASAGFESRSSGYTAITRDGGQPLEVRRLTSDGVLIDLRKDGTTVGSIATKSSDLTINGPSEHTGLRFEAYNITPRHNSSASDGVNDLGSSSKRFKDFYLSGGVFLGGTGSSNKLEDYEEGTWTPTLHGFSGGTAGGYSQQVGYYTKIGNIVIANFRFRITNKGNMTGNYTLMRGLPFNHAGSDAGTASVSRFIDTAISVSGLNMELGGSSPGNCWITRISGSSGTSDSYLTTAEVGSTFFMQGTLTYRTA